MPSDTNLRRTAFDRIIVNQRSFPRLTVSRKVLIVRLLFSNSKLRPPTNKPIFWWALRVRARAFSRGASGSTRIFVRRKNQIGWDLLRLSANFVDREEFLTLSGQTINELIVTHFKTTFPRSPWSGRSSFGMRRKQGMANEQRAHDRGEAEK
jgi:hypothetical protein